LVEHLYDGKYAEHRGDKLPRRRRRRLNEVVCLDEQEREEVQSRPSELLEADTSSISSPTLARLIEEVRNEEANSAHAYNRMHNRHNRSR
jgi:hypothetical protein